MLLMSLILSWKLIEPIGLLALVDTDYLASKPALLPISGVKGSFFLGFITASSDSASSYASSSAISFAILIEKF